MSTPMFPTNSYPRRARSNVRSTVTLLTVAALGYVAGAVVHGALPRPNAAAAFAAPVVAAQVYTDDALSSVAIPGTDESHRYDPERSAMPRECDLASGVSTVCLFMD